MVTSLHFLHTDLTLPSPPQQWRLFPYIAAAYALDTFSKTFNKNFYAFRMESLNSSDKDRMVSLGGGQWGVCWVKCCPRVGVITVTLVCCVNTLYLMMTAGTTNLCVLHLECSTNLVVHYAQYNCSLQA